jgi:PHD/YefM family antitoxin component YafN of YafNO toxin-antitoxin module
METEKELNAKIMAITILIKEKHPELANFLDEMPITIPNENNPEINIKMLKEYYESLRDTLKKYLLERSPSALKSNSETDKGIV